MTSVATARSETARALRVRAHADIAANVIAPYYGLDAAIAVNPLLPSLGEGFVAAASRAASAVGGRGFLLEEEYREHLATARISASELARIIRRHRPGVESCDADLVEAFLAEAGPGSRQSPELPARDAIDERVAGWCRAALVPEAAAWPVPVERLGFYGAWRALASRDLSLPRAARRRIVELPPEADAALVRALDLLEVHEDERVEVLRSHVASLPGWSAYIRWRALSHGDVEILDLLAVRFALIWALDAPVRRSAACDTAPEMASERAVIWQEAFETRPHDDILRMLDPGGTPDDTPPRVHLVFCIDPRSEGIRRHLESQGCYATSGFAGFFGIAAAVEPIAAGEAGPACPVLLTPRYQVSERPKPGTWRATASLINTLATRRALRGALKGPDSVAGAPLGWAEATGWVLGPQAISRSILAGRVRRAARPDEESVPTLFDIDSALTLDDQVDTAEVILRTMSMVENFAPIVVLVGHGTTTTNNAYRTALDCGACGGHRGAPNARIAAALLSSPDVRAGLAERGIVLPSSTVVIAAEHDTATDTLTFFDVADLRVDRRQEVAQLARDAARAGAALAAERSAELPGSPRRGRPVRHVARRAADWAQVYPEWGLARNSALVIGPRSMSKGAHLDRRAFLHSYEPEHDHDGVALETILTAPLVVAHWINAQYYFSSVDPDVFGAGSKTLHNLVGGAGVVSGPSGDLRLGLPWQSVGTRRGLHHEPVRLLVVVDAPRDRIDRIIESAEVVSHLVLGEWVMLVRPGDGPGRWERRTREGWHEWTLSARDALTTKEEDA